MFLRVAALVFIFLARLKFPSHLSIGEVIRIRYGNEVLKIIRDFEKLDFKYRKVLLDLKFLEECRKYNVIPKFLRFRLANRNLQNSNAYLTCQKRLLQEEISNKKSKIRIYKNEITSSKEFLYRTLSIIDYYHICNLFLASNDKRIIKQQFIQVKKLGNLIPGYSTDLSDSNHDPKKVIYNFSNYRLSDGENSLLSKGLNFAIPPSKLEYADFLLPFELLYRDTLQFDELSTQNRDFLRTKIKDTCLSTFNEYNGMIKENNITDSEQKSLFNF